MQLLIFDGQYLACQNLKAVIEAWDQTVEIHSPANISGVIHILKELQPCIILVDVSVPKRCGLKAIPMAKEKSKAIKIIVLSLNRYLMDEVLAAGADAFVNKCDHPEKLWEALAKVAWDRKRVDVVPQSIHHPHQAWKPTIDCTNCKEES